MSRIGAKFIKIPSQIKRITHKNNTCKIDGIYGTLEETLTSDFKLIQKEQKLYLKCSNLSNKKNKALYGLYRSLIKNMIIGVSQQFEIVLNFVGVEFKKNKDSLLLDLGYENAISILLPSTFKLIVEGNTKIILQGIDLKSMSTFAGKIREFKKPDPYKGRGILEENEIVKIKIVQSKTKTKGKN